MARRGRYQSKSNPNERHSGRLRSIAREEEWRTGRKEPGSLLRAFGKKYPNRNYSTRLGPETEND